MKAKKLVLAIAIFGGMLFTAQAAVEDGSQNPTSEVDRPKIKKKPPTG